MDETEFRSPSIFYEAVAIGVAVMINPCESALDVRPNRLNECEVTRAPVVSAGKDDEKRRCVDATVIALERNLAQDGHLTRARLVKDLARLSVLLGVLHVRLRGSQVCQDAARETGIKPQALERSNNSVSSEFRAEPGNASIRIRPIRCFRPHHLKICEGAIQPIIEL